jgi:hypothetical protein
MSDNLPLFTEGIMGDGAVLLKDGAPVPIEDVVAALNDAVYYQKGLEDIKKHQWIIGGGSLAALSTTYQIAVKALRGRPR